MDEKIHAKWCLAVPTLIVYMPIRNPLNLFRGSNLTLPIENLWMFGTAKHNFACIFLNGKSNRYQRKGFTHH